MHNIPHVLASQIVWSFSKSVHKTRKTKFFARTEKNSLLKISNALYRFQLSNIILSRQAVKSESIHGSSNGRCCFCCFSHFLSNILEIIFYVENMVRSECLDLVKHIYLIQSIILIRLRWLSGISKICVSFADKYSKTGVYRGIYNFHIFALKYRLWVLV